MIISVDPAQSEDIATFALVKQYNLHSFSVNLTAASWVTDSVNGGYKYEVEYGDETYYFVYLEPNAIVSYYNDLEDPTNFAAACDAGITLESVDAVEESSQSYVLLFHAETLPDRDVTINVLLYGDKIKDSEGQHDIPPTPSELLERIIALEEGKVDKLETTGKFAYTHTDSTQGEVAIVDGTTANTLPIRDNSGRMHSASPSAGSNDTTVATTSWTTTKLGNYVTLDTIQNISGGKTFLSGVTIGNPTNNGGLEIYHTTPFIDFHHNKTTTDFTARIINSADGELSFAVQKDDGTSPKLARIYADGYVVAPARTYNVANTSDVVTIGMLNDVSNVLVFKGVKYTDGNIYWRDPTYARTDTFTQRTWMSTQLRFIDKNNAENARIQVMYDSSGKHELHICAADSAGTEKTVVLSSAGYVTGPYRIYNSSNTYDVVTIGSLKASTDVVHTTGNETVAGTKTFSANIFTTNSLPMFNTVSTVLTQSTIPSTNTNAFTLRAKGSDNVDIGTINIRKYASGATRFYVSVFNTGATESAFGLNIDTAGNKWLDIPSAPPSQSAARNITISTSNPSGGNNGDIWIKYTA